MSMHVADARGTELTSTVTVREEVEHTGSGRRVLGHRAAATTSVRLTDPELIGQHEVTAAIEVTFALERS